MSESQAQSTKQLSADELLVQFTDMVRWWHYDPHCTPRPSEFSLDELEQEISRRLAAATP